MRRYTDARNAIERLRERWGLGDTPQAQSIPDGQGPGPGSHPLPTTVAGAPIPYLRPLPVLPDRPLLNPGQPAGAGATNYAARQRTQLATVPKGSPAEPTLVYPAWESRLVNMRDFLVPLSFAFAEGAFNGPGTMLLEPFQVPQGYTAFLKEFRLVMDPLPAALTEGNTRLTLLLDGAPVPQYTLMPLGALMNDPQKTFVIAEEGRLLNLRIDISVAVLILETTAVNALFYGNLRIRTGAHVSREVGVAAPRPSLPPPVAARAPPAAPPPPSTPSVPPVRIEWTRGMGGSVRSAQPMAMGANGRWRGLTAQERHDYAQHIESIRPPGANPMRPA